LFEYSDIQKAINFALEQRQEVCFIAELWQ